MNIKMEPTILIGRDVIEYVIDKGLIVEKCLHKTRTDESSGQIMKETCHDCKKVLFYRDKSTEVAARKSYDPIEEFTKIHGRNPKGYELSAFIL